MVSQSKLTPANEPPCNVKLTLCPFKMLTRFARTFSATGGATAFLEGDTDLKWKERKGKSLT